ncbi:hypothetical protein [Pseudolysinimonas sp.]|uniref:hypothetical protein n=1 Tax=Pseudolysinimonas sp. TaxID=2680009 RepID=UPI003F820937
MSDTSSTTPVSVTVAEATAGIPAGAGAPATMATIAKDIEQLGADANIQALEKTLLGRIPKNIRGGIYEAGKAAGMVGAAGFSVAAVLEGKQQLFVLGGAALLLSLSSWISKANLV